MGTPNNPQQRTTQDILRDILRQHTASEQDLRATGLDVDLLEATFEMDIRPYLDYLHGYQDLTDLDPLERLRDTWYYDEPWVNVVTRHGLLGQHRRVLLVFNSGLYRYHNDRAANNMHVGVYLTRKGTWLLFHCEQSYPRYTNEHITTAQGVQELCEVIRSAKLDEYSIHSGHKYSSSDSIPLAIEYHLQRVLRETITERQKRLDSMTAALGRAEHRISIVKFGR